jgi:hypothetical protein
MPVTRPTSFVRLALAFSFFALAGASPGCSSESSAPAASSRFEPEADFAAEGGFFAFPYPSDLRLTKEGTPDVASFPNPNVEILDGLKKGAGARKGFPVVPVGYFTFTAKPQPFEADDVVPGGAAAPLLLVDVDAASPDRGKLFPVVAKTHAPDAYVPENLVAIAARPGIILAPGRKYAFVATTRLAQAPEGGGGSYAAPPMLAALARGEAPATTRGPALRDLYAPLWETADKIGLARADIVAATVFTTGDVVADTSALGDRVLAKHTVSIEGFELAPDPDGKLSRVCHVRAKVTMPQFQRGTPPFNTEGLFDLDADGVPKKQRDEVIPISIALPRAPMPSGGYPLIVYFHGSGGVASEVVDGGGKSEVGEDNLRWPASTLAPFGFATAASALPISPERVPGVQAYDYINVNNPVAMRDTFRQGILEQRMLLSAWKEVHIPPSVIAACSGPTLPAGETDYHFSLDRLSVQGQSMGAMYTNLISASDPRIHAAVPTGAGGYWMYFILKTKIVAGAAGLLSVLLGTREQLTVLHPAMQIAETALEPIDPIVSAPRLALRPLAGHDARSIYEPVGIEDSYFPTVIFDAMALAYHHPRAGTDVWPTMREAQSLVGLDAPVSYPLKGNLKSESGATYTGVVAQYAPPQGQNGHAIYRNLDAVIHQYTCFHATFRKGGVAVISPPDALDAPCAE